jgi:uncharacterized protein involved in exopolysaccharide biosynthesis
MTRSANDWGALVVSELRGAEQPGTTARLIAEATGKPLADAGHIGTEAEALSSLAEVIKNPKLLADIRRESDAHKAERKALAAEKAEVAKAKRELEEARAKEAAERDHEVRNHQAAIAAAQAELASVKKQAAEFQAKAERDAQKAAELKTELARRMRFAETGAAA